MFVQQVFRKVNNKMASITGGWGIEAGVLLQLHGIGDGNWSTVYSFGLLSREVCIIYSCKKGAIIFKVEQVRPLLELLIEWCN